MGYCFTQMCKVTCDLCGRKELTDDYVNTELRYVEFNFDVPFVFSENELHVWFVIKTLDGTLLVCEKCLNDKEMINKMLDKAFDKIRERVLRYMMGAIEEV